MGAIVGVVGMTSICGAGKMAVEAKLAKLETGSNPPLSAIAKALVLAGCMMILHNSNCGGIVGAKRRKDG